MKKTKRIPKSATRFDAVSIDLISKSSEEDASLEMVCYSGGVVKDHFWWGNLGIDLDGMKFSKDKYPIFSEHDIDRKIGYMGKPVIDKDKGLIVDSSTVTFVDTEYAKEFIRLSKEGFPFQASIYAKPIRVEEIPNGEESEVNGHKINGEGSIWRESEFKEVSVCVFGADSNTEAKVFKDDEMIDVEYCSNLNDQTKGGGVRMPITLEKLKKEHPDIVKTIQDEAISKTQEQFNQKNSDLQKIVNVLEKANEDLKEENNKFSERLAELEKENAIRRENDIRAKSVEIFKDLLSKSDISERMHDKVMLHVSYEKFVKEDVLDVEAFSAAVKDEIVDWESKGVVSSILGSGVVSKSVDEDNTRLQEKNKENEKVIDRMLNLVGLK